MQIKLCISELTCLVLDCGGRELTSTGELEGLHSSGKGLGMDGTEAETDSDFPLEKFRSKKMNQKEPQRKPIISSYDREQQIFLKKKRLRCEKG